MKNVISQISVDSNAAMHLLANVGGVISTTSTRLFSSLHGKSIIMTLKSIEILNILYK